MNSSVYARPDKPRFMETYFRGRYKVKSDSFQISNPIELDKATECHVTPLTVAKRMVEYSEVRNNSVLEPSAGTGNLIQALLNDGNSEITAVEKNPELSRYLTNNFENIETINMCLLNYANSYDRKKFPRIIMNPPFREVKKHISSAFSLLGLNGHFSANNTGPATLVALVPSNFDYPDAVTMERLNRNTFSTTSVMTKIIRIRRYI